MVLDTFGAMSAGSIGREETIPQVSSRLSAEWGGMPFPAQSTKQPVPHDAKRSPAPHGVQGEAPWTPGAGRRWWNKEHQSTIEVIFKYEGL